MAASLVPTSRTHGQLRGVLARIALAASQIVACFERYGSGDWDDPPGKLALLYDLERVRELVRGHHPFDPARDHAVFARFLVDTGCQPPPSTGGRRQRIR